MPIQRVKKTRVPDRKRFEIYHMALMPEFLIADTRAEAAQAKKDLEQRHGGRARIVDLETDPHNGG